MLNYENDNVASMSGHLFNPSDFLPVFLFLRRLQPETDEAPDGRPRSFVSFEESSSVGSGGIFERGAGGSESGLVATSLLRKNARPRKPIAIKIAPAIISQCG